MEFREYRTADGTTLSYFRAGSADGPGLVLCNGIGAGANVWEPLVERYADRYALIGWDYRGLYGSGDSADYRVERHAEDLLELMDREAIGEAVVMGWSMGAQVMLEVYRARPDACTGLISLNGTYGRIVRTALDSPLASRVVEPLLDAVRTASEESGHIGRSVATSPALLATFTAGCQRLHWLAESLDREAFVRLMEGWLSNDLRVYAALLQHLEDHDASDLLPQVHVPLLVISGGLDMLTPPHLANDMVAAAPRAQLVRLERASHFAIMEEPEGVYAAMDGFLPGLR